LRQPDTSQNRIEIPVLLGEDDVFGAHSAGLALLLEDCLAQHGFGRFGMAQGQFQLPARRRIGPLFKKVVLTRHVDARRIER
jgi:hypothetical protein